MNARLRAFARVGAAAAAWGEEKVASEVRDAIAAGVPAHELHEVLLQSYLFVGYPRAINALIAFAGAVGATMPAPAPEAQPDLARWRERGEALCRQIYGQAYDRMRENMRRLHPDLAEWMLVEGYGKVLARPQLTARFRELAVLGILAATGQERQLESHVRGARRVGASADEVREAIACVADLAQPAMAGASAARLADTVLQLESRP